jgi:ubiquitin-protein ligase
MQQNNKALAEYNASRNILAIINDLKIIKEDKIRKRDTIGIIGKKTRKEELLEEYKKVDKLGLIKYKSRNFFLSNTIDFPVKISKYFEKFEYEHVNKMAINLKKNYFKCEGIQIYGLIDNKIIGVIEGPPKTSFENGFFLFEFIIGKSYPFDSKNESKFYFKTKIFHPNVGTDGLLCKYESLFQIPMTLASTIIYVQSILDEPNLFDWYNAGAAMLYEKNRIEYEETVKRYTSQYASFINLQSELSKYELNFKHIEEKNNK